MKAFKLILLTTLALVALQSAIDQALLYYQNNELNRHTQAVNTLIHEAKNGNNSAAFLVATAYKNGKLGAINLDRAYYFYQLGANRGDVDAMLMLGWLDYKGTPEFGIRIKYAKYWFRKASKKGLIEATDMLELLESNEL